MGPPSREAESDHSRAGAPRSSAPPTARMRPFKRDFLGYHGLLWASTKLRPRDRMRGCAAH